jgi:hypothetical protein
MKTAQEWFDYHHKTKLWSPGDPPALISLIHSIQSDAARSERERAARVCEKRAEDFDRMRRDNLDVGNETMAVASDHHRLACTVDAMEIRALPDRGANQ